jgi:tRNA(Arg) A34 adenosine deaminase TadA
MSLDKPFFALLGPTLIGPGECAAIIADAQTYYVAKAPIPAKADPFSPIINLIEWLNIKEEGGGKAAKLKDNPIYHIGWDLAIHETTMASQNNWTLEKLGNKKPTPKDQSALEMRVHRERAIAAPIPAQPLSAALAKFKISQLAPGPAVLLTDNKLQKLYMLSAFSIAAQKAKDHGRVIAILTHSSGEIWSYGIKSHENSILHAEVTAIQNLFVNEPQRAARLKTEETWLFTTLKPCRMCAAMISACGAGKIHVVYGQNDSGAEATDTCLDWNAGKHHKLAVDLNLKDKEQKLKDPLPKTLLTGLEGVRALSPGGPIVHLLDGVDSRALMTLAHARTVHKVQKYDQAQDSDKKRVMAHLASFLRAIEVIEAQQ